MDLCAVRRVSIPLDEIVACQETERDRKVLLVTEDEALRAAACEAFENAGYLVVTAAHSGHALLVSLTEGPIHILAADLSMDDLSGPALASRLRRHYPDLQTLYFGGRSSLNIICPQPAS